MLKKEERQSLRILREYKPVKYCSGLHQTKKGYLCTVRGQITPLYYLTKRLLQKYIPGFEVEGAVSARMKLLELIEKNDDGVYDKLPPGIAHKVLSYTSGGVSLIYDGEKYKKLLKTEEGSAHFITAASIIFSYGLSCYEKELCESDERSYFHTPFDQALALWNSLCYHRDAFLSAFSKRDNLILYLYLTCCVCEVLKFMLTEFEKYGF